MHARLRPSVKRSLVFLAVGAALAAGFASRAVAAWSSAPVTVASSAGTQAGPILVNAPNGVYVGWTDRRDTSGVWANRVDSAGVAESAIGFPVGPPDSAVTGPVATADGTGGMVLAWSDLRSAPRAIFANRITTSGSHQWTRNGVRVSTGAGAQVTPSVASDGAGGVFVAWQDSRNGNADIFAQHVLADGSLAWGASGVAVCTDDSTQESPQIVADRMGGAVVSWEDRRNNSLTSTQVYLQRLAASGAVRFAANGISVDGNSSTTRARLACEPNASTVVMFADTIGSGSSYGLFAQRFDSTGTSLYTGGNRAVLSANANPLWPVAVFARNNGQALFVYASPTEIRARVQSATGADVWGGSNGTALSGVAPVAAAGVGAIPDGADGAWVTWTDGNAVRTQHVLSGGSLPMGNTPVTMSPATTRTRGNAVGALLPTGDFVAAWEDADTGGSPDTNLVLQRLGPNRIVGAYWRVVASKGGGGSLTPGAGVQIVAEHDSLRFVATADPGFHVATMIADAVGYGPVPNLTFHDITSNHTLTVSFDNAQLTQQVITAADSYRLLSFPFAFSNDTPDSVFRDLWPPDPARWRVGRWDPVAKLYGTPSTSFTHVEAGKGFWLATHVADTLDFFGAPVSQSDLGVALTPSTAESTGWNQIGVPFRFPLAVSALRVRSGGGAYVPLVSSQTCTDSVVIGWDTVNGYQPVTTLLPGRGYWLFKRTAANVTLRFPYEYSQGAFAGTPEPQRSGDWALALTLSQAGAPDAHLTLGADERTRTLARFPASPGRDLALWTRADGADASAALRPDAALLAWDVFASGEGALAPATLAVAFDGLPAGREVVLADPATGWSRVVADGDRVQLAVGGDARRLVLSVRAAGGPAVTGVTTLRALAPNPFRDHATLSFVLGMPGDLRAYVYDVTGRRVADLSRRGLAAGEHVIGWDGRDGSGEHVAPGVYLVRWSAGGRSGSARIVSLQ
ncbi:MAG: FlgD immunoglobulin-like domain containing protein [Candidatus Eisenbacteria bacterium]